MKSSTITHTGSGGGVTNSSPVRVNWRGGPVSLAFETDGSTTGFTAQYTVEDPTLYASASAWASAATWYDALVIDGVSANSAEVLDGVIQGIRLQADASGTDTGTLTVLQRPNL